MCFCGEVGPEVVPELSGDGELFYRRSHKPRVSQCLGVLMVMKKVAQELQQCSHREEEERQGNPKTARSLGPLHVFAKERT